MRLPEITLDDRQFQDLVNEARVRVSQACPEWTDHNVSDPGVTLIELFAWMTETAIYRLNRVPDKLHVTLLDLLGIHLQSPTAASTELRFRLAAPATSESLRIPAETEVGTVRTVSDEATVFLTAEDFVVPAAQPIAYVVDRAGKRKDVGIAAGTATPKGSDQLPFSTPPQVGDALLLGFDASLGRLLIQVEVDCSQARGVGIDPEDPPLRWEMSTGDGPDDWAEAEVLDDRTGGFNYGSGIVEIQCPPDSAVASIAGHRAHWLRCRLISTTRSGAPAVGGSGFSNPPEIYSISAAPIGALIAASHCAREAEERLGESDGTPGQTFRMRRSPVLAPTGNETLEVLDPEGGGWTRWDHRESFAESGSDDFHFVLDLANGEVELGPAIRAPRGGWRQYGAVPPRGAELRFTSYRHGGGRGGNVAARQLTILKGAIPGVATVTNPRAAFGGVDPETVANARQRAALELRTRYRAVTAEDFEFLAGEASARVARVVCVPPEAGGAVRVHILPRIEPADRKLDFDEVIPDEPLLAEVAAYLDERRLIGTTVQVLPVKLRGVTVVVNLQASVRSDLRRVEQEVSDALYTYINPLVGGGTEGPGTGWEFGRALNQGELYGVVHSVDGVDHVKILRVYETDARTGKQEAKPAGAHISLEPDESLASGTHIVKAEHREY